MFDGVSCCVEKIGRGGEIVMILSLHFFSSVTCLIAVLVFMTENGFVDGRVV